MGSCKSQGISAQRNITQPSKVIIVKTMPAEKIADRKALQLAGHRIYLHRDPCKGSWCLRVCEKGGGEGSQPGFQGGIFSSLYLYLCKHGLCNK